MNREELVKSHQCPHLITGTLPKTPKRPPNYPHSGREKVLIEGKGAVPMMTITRALVGAITLLLGWGVGTLVHEGCHIAGAYACGIPASLGTCTLSTGSVILYGDITSTQTAVIALAGSLGLVIAGVLLVRLSVAPVVRMIGVIFLCRAWVDVLPVAGYDGGLIAGSVGFMIAAIIVSAEVLICGGVIMDTIMNTKELRE